MNYKIGIIGNRDAVLGFMALGFSVHEVSSVSEATKELHSMARSQEYGVIFLTEDYAEKMEEETAKYRDLPLPAIISIPAPGGSSGYGMNNLRQAVERAVGADILFKNNESAQTENEERK
ncbi:MAG: V-type ATP synthase subunit F [Ruminococcaceae bacterium]|nr:V-type ATP synthase subunit F [Oscillospiraceae bacterium]